MTRTFAQQKAALTRVKKTGDLEKVKAEVLRTVTEWESGEGQFTHGWPDDWHRWNRAMQDVGGWQAPTIESLGL
jgi:hypothetical protein